MHQAKIAGRGLQLHQAKIAGRGLQLHQAKIAGRGLQPRPKPLLAGIDGRLRTGLQTPSGRSCMNKNSWL